MARTKTEIATRVLKKLGRLPDGQVATASQKKTVTDEYDDLYQELLEDENVSWSEDDDIPNNVARFIIVILLGRVAEDFGVPDRWSLLEDFMRKKIAAQLASPYTYQPTQFNDY